MRQRLRFLMAYGLYCVTVCGLLLLAVEGMVRAFTDRPHGLFDATPLNHTSLYHPDSRIVMELMAFPYVIETNHLGFRGPEITPDKPPGTTRIIALGDSITDGYLVDNPHTYPAQLQDMLSSAGRLVEVVNAARGGSTIGREFWILRRFCAELNPDVVVLTFVGNDIYEMGNRSVEQLLQYHPEPLVFANRAALWAARSATGEWILDRYFAARFTGYRGRNVPGAPSLGPERYVIPGATDYGALLPQARADLQALKLHLPALDAALQERAHVYLTVLSEMKAWCDARDIQLVWVWFPTFVQTYAETPDEPFYHELLPRVAAAGIPVIDGVPAFRQADRGTPLYLAPVDYHLTPAGNALLARTIANGLGEHGILAAANKEVE